MFLYRKVDASPAPAVLLQGPPLRASDEAMTSWLAAYQAALDKTEPQHTEARTPSAHDHVHNLLTLSVLAASNESRGHESQRQRQATIRDDPIL